MILQRLAEHYDRIVAEGEAELAPPGSSVQKVSFCLVLEPDGGLHSIEDLRRPEGKSLRPRNLVVPGQGKPSGSGVNPRFLWDNTEYLLGWSADPAKVERAPKAFAAFRDMHLALEGELAQLEFTAVCNFLRQWTPEQAQAYLPELAERASHFGVFRVLGEELRYVHELVSPPVAQGGATARSVAHCLVSGEFAPVARLHEPRIKGVAGAQTAGALLVSFNATAFTSYGKEQSANAPVSLGTTFKYANALNHLLERRDRRIGLGDATVIFWADGNTILEEMAAAALGITFATEPDDDDPGEIGQTTREDRVRVQEARTILARLRDGAAEVPLAPDEARTRFYILGLSPNASRLSVRLWVEQDAGELQRKLGQHVRDLALRGGRDDRLLSIRNIVESTGRAERDRGTGRLKKFNTDAVSPQLAGELARSVLTGAAYPQSLLATMIRRIRSDGEVAFARVSAIKAVLVRHARMAKTTLEIPMELDTQKADIAYRCGRLFALLEKAQADSLGGELNATVKDRYFSSASATPALVFPRLFRLNGHHLAKLEPRSKIFYERLIGSTMSDPFHFPRQLGLTEQGQFVVGYFQQRQDLYTKKEKAPQEEIQNA